MFRKLTCYRLALIPAALILGCFFCAEAPGQADAPPEAARKILTAFRDAEKSLAKIEKENASPEALLRLQTNDDYLLAKLAMQKIQIIAQDRMVVPEIQIEDIRKQLKELEACLTALSAGKLLERPFTGLHEWAYFARQDDSVQPYYAYVPETVKDKKDLPLVVFLHGYVSTMNMVNWYESSSPTALYEVADKERFIVALAFGRSLTEFMGIGEVDVLEVIEQLKKRYPIDARKIYLAGISMGGSGTWTIGAHYPHLFAGIMPIAGRTDYYLWKGLAPDKIAPFKRFLTDMNYVSAMPRNFFNLGIFCTHGKEDTLLDPQQSRTMIERLRKEHITHPVFNELETGDHHTIWTDAFISPKLTEWMSKTRLDPWPARITYKTYSPKYGRAYWATIEEFEKFGRPATILVEAQRPDVIEIKTENVARLKLTIDGKALALRGKITVKSDRLVAPDEIVIGDAPQEIELTLPGYKAPEGPSKAFGKAPGPGPIADALNEPFLMVYGGEGATPRDNPTFELTLTNASHWYMYARGIPRIKADKDVTPEDIRDYHLILFGTPRTNRKITEIADKLPITIGENFYTVGDKTYKGEDLGAIMIAPNPLNPKKYVVVHAGKPWGMGLEVNHRYDFLPDFIIFQDQLDPDTCNHYLSAGFFDNEWKLDPDLIWTQEPLPPLQPKQPEPAQ